LIFQRLANEAEGVHILYLGLGAEFLLSAGPHADVRVAAQRALLHIAIADAGIKDDLFQPRQIGIRLLRRADVGLADNLNQRHAGAIQVDGGLLGGLGEAFVQALAGVLFQVYASDAYLLFAPVRRHLDVARLGQRLVILRGLVSLGQI